jgi:hypothetical protein
LKQRAARFIAVENLPNCFGLSIRTLLIRVRAYRCIVLRMPRQQFAGAVIEPL